MRAMITAYREDNNDIEFKFIHVFARIETCDKWSEMRSALSKGKFDPDAAPALTSDDRPMGAKRAKALRDAAPGIKKLHSSIMACMADAASHAAERAEQAAKMEQVAAVRWALVIERQDAKLELIKANVAAKKRREDLSILMVDTAGMDDDVREWWKAQRTAILYEVRGPPASTSVAAASTSPAPEAEASPATATPPPDVDVDAAV
jgi:hypothetical protein